MTGRKIDAMWQRFGGGPADKQCRDCRNCVRNTPTDRHYWKCLMYGDTNSEATDWRLKWPACGCFDRDSGETPVLDQLKRQPRRSVRAECEGQISFGGI